MRIKKSIGERIFNLVNYCFLTGAALLCVLPFINLIAISFSGQGAVNANLVKLLPVEFTLKSYELVIGNMKFLRSLLISVERAALGLVINMLMTILVAYPLSKEKTQFKSRQLYVNFFLGTILFSGGLIPWYIVINKTGLMNNILALIIPNALPVFNMIVIMNFFRGIPKEMEEAAFVDGATHWRTLWQIYIPLSTPSLATVSLFVLVNHWNAWFDGLLLMNKTDMYPLQSYLRTAIIDPETYFRAALTGVDSDILDYANIRTTKAAQLLIGAFPLLVIYPLLQKYFTTGLVMGSVKG